MSKKKAIGDETVEKLYQTVPNSEKEADRFSYW